MKFIKLFEDFKLKSINIDGKIPEDIQKDIEDICIEFDDLKVNYYRSVGFKCEFHWENDWIQIFSIREGGIKVNYPIESIKEITNRIQRYIKMKDYKCKIFYDEQSTHYYNQKWNRITESTIIVFYKNKIEVKY